MSKIADLERILESGRDDALLRYSLGNEYLKAGAVERAIQQLAVALEGDPEYSAAWKLYAKALAEAGRLQDSVGAYDQGITIAERKGDIQAAKEMRVFRKRIEKQLSDP